MPTFGLNAPADEVAPALVERIKGKTGEATVSLSNLFDTLRSHITGARPASIGLAAAKAIAKHEPGLLVITHRSQVKYVELDLLSRGPIRCRLQEA
jgi:hypothetical protein